MLHSWTLEPLQLQDAWLSIGSFDGIHIGHQAILAEIIHGAHREGAPAVVLTFHPHPGEILGKRSGAFYLNTPEEKAEIMSLMGLDYLVTHPFNPGVASLTAREFVIELKQKLGFRKLCVGDDFALGRDRQGDLKALEVLGREFDYRIELIEPVRHEGKVVSSSWVRKALAEGDLRLAHTLLGRPFSVTGEVIHGDNRGKSLGFPTANLEPWKKRALPGAGVYACWALISGETIPAVSNIGFRPTFEEPSGEPRLEAHLLDFDGDLYGRNIQLSFIERLRGEQRFNHVQALVDQVRKDIQISRKILKVSSNATVPGSTSVYSRSGG